MMSRVRCALLLLVISCQCPASAHGASTGIESWTVLRRDTSVTLVPPGDPQGAVLLHRLPDQTAEADFKHQFLSWRDVQLKGSTASIVVTQPPVFGRSARGDWGSWAGQVETAVGTRWWLFMARREQAKVVGVLLDAADATRFDRHARVAVDWFDTATAAIDAPSPAAGIAPRSMIGVWTNLPSPADTAHITRARLLAAAGSGLWLELRADGTMRYASKAPRAATAPGLVTASGNPMLVTGGDRLDGRYQEGRWSVEGDELVLAFDRGRHLDAIDDGSADKSWYRGGGRRYPMEWTADGRLRLAVMPGQWMDAMSRVAGP